MTIASAAVLDRLDGGGLYDDRRNRELWAQVPELLRLELYAPEVLPAHPAFRWRLVHPYHREIDLRPLPGPMRRELAFAFWRIIEQGLQITTRYACMARSLELVLLEWRSANGPSPRSLMDRSLRDWEREWRLARARQGPVVAQAQGRVTRTRRSGSSRWIPTRPRA